MRSKLFGFYRNIMKIFYIILITSILGSCVQNGINQSEIGYANLTIVISEMSRNWTISSYEITVGTTVSEYQSAPGGVINLRLQIGTHNIEIKAKKFRRSDRLQREGDGSFNGGRNDRSDTSVARGWSVQRNGG